MKSIKVLYFARLRERLEREEERLQLDDGIVDVAALMAWLGQRGGVWQHEFKADTTNRSAVNLQMALPTTCLSDNDEVAFFPPMTGG